MFIFTYVCMHVVICLISFHSYEEYEEAKRGECTLLRATAISISFAIIIAHKK